MTPHIFYLLAGVFLVIGSAIQLGQRVTADEDEVEEVEPFGFNVVDGGVVDGGETEWEDEY